MEDLLVPSRQLYSPEDSDMRLKTLALVVVIVCSGRLVRAGEAPTDPCSLLTQVRVSEVLGASVDAGTHPNSQPPGSHGYFDCQWSEQGQPSLAGKRVLLHMFGQIGKLTPAERFENAKTPVEGITKTPVSGVGEDAYYIESGLNTSLYVRKGASVFQMIVFGFSKEQVKTMEKTLAQGAASKL